MSLSSPLPTQHLRLAFRRRSRSPSYQHRFSLNLSLSRTNDGHATCLSLPRKQRFSTNDDTSHLRTKYRELDVCVQELVFLFEASSCLFCTVIDTSFANEELQRYPDHEKTRVGTMARGLVGIFRAWGHMWSDIWRIRLVIMTSRKRQTDEADPVRWTLLGLTPEASR